MGRAHRMDRERSLASLGMTKELSSRAKRGTLLAVLLLLALLGLVPFLFATGPGSEVQRPLAIVVIGGLITSTLLTLVVLPVLYRWFEPPVEKAGS